jgi:hypothetical protein
MKTNHIRFSLISYSLLLLTLCSLSAKAQRRRYYRNYSSAYYYVSDIGKGGYQFYSFLNTGQPELWDPNYEIGHADTMPLYKVDYKSESWIKYAGVEGDTTFAQKKLDESCNITYNRAGHVLNYTRKNDEGKILDSINHTYNSKGYLIETKGYDSLKRIIQDEKFTWNANGRLSACWRMYWRHDAKAFCPGAYHDTVYITHMWSAIAYTGSGKVSAIDDSSTDVGDPHADTNVLHYRYTYDKANNLLMESSEKPKYHGVEKQSIVHTYDNTGRMLSELEYDSTSLQKSLVTLYGADGTETTTTETYSYQAPDGSCVPNHTTDITKRDSDYNQLSSLTVTIMNGDTSITKVTYTYTFFAGEIASITEQTIETAYLHECKSTTITTSTFDADTNEIKVSTVGGGEYAGNSTYTYSYDKKHNVTEETQYGSCMDKPTSKTCRTYYANGKEKEIKEVEYTDNDNSVSVLRFDSKGRVSQNISIRPYDVSKTVHTYVSW